MGNKGGQRPVKRALRNMERESTPHRHRETSAEVPGICMEQKRKGSLQDGIGASSGRSGWVGALRGRKGLLVSLTNRGPDHSMSLEGFEDQIGRLRWKVFLRDRWQSQVTDKGLAFMKISNGVLRSIS